MRSWAGGGSRHRETAIQSTRNSNERLAWGQRARLYCWKVNTLRFHRFTVISACRRRVSAGESRCPSDAAHRARMYLLYSVLLVLTALAGSPWFAWQALRHRKYVGSVRERLGRLPVSLNLDG